MKKGSKHSKETLNKMSQRQKENPTNYWKGKKRDMPWLNGKRGGNKEYFKTNKFIGENHDSWKGDDVGYDSLHRWVVRYKGQPDTCEKCGQGGFVGHQIHWANIDHKYRRVLDDYIRLCAQCHRDYDKENNGR